MRRHVRIVAFVVAAAAGLAVLAPAQEGGKMGTINSQEILEKSTEGQKALAQLQAADKKYTDEITRMDDQIQQLQNRLSAQRLTLTVSAAAGIQADIQKKQTERQRAIEDAGRAMRELQAKILEQIQNELVPLIEQLRQDKGLDLIVDLAKSGTVFYNPTLDLTAEAIGRYNALKASPEKKSN